MAQKRIRVAYEFECADAAILDFDHHQMLQDIAKSFNKAGLTVQPRISSVAVDIEVHYGPPRWETFGGGAAQVVREDNERDD